MLFYIYRFACQGRTLNLKENDKLHFICPDVKMSRNPIAQGNLYEKAYLLGENQQHEFDTCNATGIKLIICYQPNQPHFLAYYKNKSNY